MKTITMMKSGGILAIAALGVGCATDDPSGEITEPALAERQFNTTGMEEHLSKARAARGRMFLTQNATRSGVKTRPSGLQIEVLEPGDGETPTLKDTVVTHYRVSSVDGKVLDNSEDYGEPQEFRVNEVIAGWREALQDMKVGSKWKLFVPPELAYGNLGMAQIPGGETLIYEIELLGVKRGGPSDRVPAPVVDVTEDPDPEAPRELLTGGDFQEPGDPVRAADRSLDTLDLLD